MNNANNQIIIRNSEVNRVVKYNLLFAVISFLLLIALELILPSIKIPLRFYNRIYTLLNFSTAHLDFSKLVTYLSFLICGFAFVNLVNLKNKRNNPLIGPNGYADTKKVVLFGFFIFFVSANFLLLGKYDFEGFCNSKAKIKNTSDDALNYFNKLYDYQPHKSNEKENNNNLKENNLNFFGNKQNKEIVKINVAKFGNEENAENKKQFESRKNHPEDNLINYNNKKNNENNDDREEVIKILNDLYNSNNKKNNENYSNDDFNKENKNSFMHSKIHMGFFKKLTYNISLGLYAFSKNLAEYFKPEFYFKTFKTECKYPVFFERVFQNYFFFILPFIFGLNFTYLDDIPELQKFNLAWHDMKNWGMDLWALFVALCLFILFTIGFLFYSLINTSLIRFGVYLLFMGVLIIYVFVRTNKEKKNNKHFHLHHYALMLVLNLFLGIHHDYFMILLGVFSGIMIEGSCRWGVSSCWSDDE